MLAPRLLGVYGQLKGTVAGHLSWLALAALCEAMGFVSIWQLQRLIMRGVRWSDVAIAQLVGNAVSNVVPAGSAVGAVVQLRMLGRRDVDLATAVSSLALASSLTALSGVGVFAVVLALPVGGSHVTLSGWQVLGIGAIPLVVLCVVVSAMSDRFGPALDGLAATVARRLPHASGLREVPLRLAAQRHWVRTLFAERRLMVSTALVGHALGDYLALYVAVLAVGVHPTPAAVLVAFLTANAAGAIPFTPGGLGFVEAGLTGALGMSGVAQPEALAAVAIYRLASCWLPVAAGATAYSIAMLRRRSGERPVCSPAAGGGTVVGRVDILRWRSRPVVLTRAHADR